MSKFDYIIVGAGTAGCTLAGRLSENPNIRVCLLEAGPPDRSVFIHMPAGFEALFRNRRYNWMYESEPESHLGGRRIYCPRGRTLGGSSSINGQTFLRGHACDYDEWDDEFGLASWSYRQVLPYFKRMESWAGGISPYRGTDGPIGVTRPDPPSNPLSRAFIEAGTQAGHDFTPDVNGFQQEGVFFADQSIRQGRRSSSAVGYLRKRDNLTIYTGAVAKKIIFDDDRAVGLMVDKGGKVFEIRCECEVLVSAGAVNSPQLLMLSGIGDADKLKRFGIPVIQDIPGVGANLQDHAEFYLLTECSQPVSLYNVMNPMAKVKIGMQWLLTRRGPGATNHFEAGAYFRTDPGLRSPNIQNILIPLATTYDGDTSFEGHGFAISVGLMRPKSRGEIGLRSARIEDAPEIRFNFLQAQSDIDELQRGLEMTRDIISQPALAPYRGREISPGRKVQNKASITEYLRGNLGSVFHLCGTCRMGYDDMAVVDDELRVSGIRGLRVVDASVIPSIPGANINATVHMIGEIAADMIMGKKLLAPENLPCFAVGHNAA